MKFEQILDKYGGIVDKELGKFFDEKTSQATDNFLRNSYGCLKEFVLRPGKRIRPIAAIMAYKAINDSNEQSIYPVCIAPELFHTSSLIHDDIMDEDLLRRNKPSMHSIFRSYFGDKFAEKNYDGDLFDSDSKRFSVSMAIIQGNLLYSLAISSILGSMLDEKTKNESLKICNNAYLQTNEGQIFDILMSYRESPSKDEYMSMALGKTASPISASIKFGATFNNASQQQLDSLEKYGINAGLAFQIHDDIIDMSKDMSKGRKIASDLRRGNKTIVIIKALENSNKAQKKSIMKALGNEKASISDIEKAIDSIKDSGAIKSAAGYAEKKVMIAKECLGKAGLNRQGKNFFSEFADYTIKRKE